MWPEPTPLRDRLHGSLEDLKRIASFVLATIIAYWTTSKYRVIYARYIGFPYPTVHFYEVREYVVSQFNLLRAYAHG